MTPWCDDPVGETTPQVAIPGPTSRRWGEVPHRRLGMAAWTHLANGEGICLPLRGLDAKKWNRASPGAPLAQPTEGKGREGVW